MLLRMQTAAILLLLLCGICARCSAVLPSLTGRTTLRAPSVEKPTDTRTTVPPIVTPADNVPLNMNVISWNMAEKLPIDKDCDFIKGYRSSDVVVFGIQELEDMRPRRTEGHRSRKWNSIQQKYLGRAFKCVSRHKMGGLLIAVYAKKRAMRAIQGVQTMEVACGVGNVLTNKGAVCIVLRVQNKSIALINSHLAAHQKNVELRNADYHRIMDTITENVHPEWKSNTNNVIINKALLTPPRSMSDLKQPTAKRSTRFAQKTSVPRKTKAQSTRNILTKSLSKSNSMKKTTPYQLPTVRSRDGLRAELPFDAVVFFGDLNYRIDLPRLEIERLHHRLVKNAHMGCTNRTISTGGPAVSTCAAVALEGKLQSQAQSTSAADNSDPLLADMKARFDNRYLLYATSPRKVLLEQQLDRVLLFDQLTRQRGIGAVLQGFLEGPIRFPPTYKFDKHEDRFDSSTKQRCPAWTDRILYFTRATSDGDIACAEQVVRGIADTPAAGSGVLRLHDYYSVDARTSDHRPVCADFTLHL